MSAARARRALRSRRGFTLIEMLAVLAIFFLIAAVVVPRISRASSGAVIDDAKRLGYAVDFAREKAIALRRAHRVVLDFDARSYWLEEAQRDASPEPTLAWSELERLPLVAPRSEGAKFAPVAGPSGARIALSPSAEFARVEAGGSEIASGQAALEFSPDGATPAATIWLDNGARLSVQLDIAASADPSKVTFHAAE